MAKIESKKNAVKYVNGIDKVAGLTAKELQALESVCDKYSFRANDYYLSLIDWKNENDPIRRIIIPDAAELDDNGKLDACNEKAITVAPGVQHKYKHTALLLCNETCGGFCRYCFRKRLFMEDNAEVAVDTTQGIEYIKSHPEITNVLLTGGDPLLLSTEHLEYIIKELHAIEHVKIIRIGSKMPSFNPMRITEDGALLRMLRKYSAPETRIYIMTHFDHPNELTPQAIDAIQALNDAGVTLCNQCPILKGVNDDPNILADLYNKLAFSGCAPYYLFQCRPTAGNKPYAVSMTRAYFMFEESKKYASGTAIRAKYVMSHSSGKIEIIGIDEKHIYLKYHRAQNTDLIGKVFVYKRDDNAYWLDDLEPVS